MRIIFSLAFLFWCSACISQSLRDSLFSGKLKADSALVAKSKVNQQKAKEDSVRKVQIDSLKKIGADTTHLIVAAAAPTTPTTELKYSDNNKTWKKFVDEHTPIINTEMLTTKKIKKGGYTVTLEYEIGTDGVVTTKNIICDPKSEQLVELIKERMMTNAPRLAPQIVNGAPRKSSRRQILVFVKEKN